MTKHFRFSEVAQAPNGPGVYSWYYRIELTDKDIATCIENVALENNPDIKEAIVHAFLEAHLFRYYKEVPYFVALSGQLKPRYEGLILVIIGNAAKELDTDAKRRSFERFRERLVGVRVLTFDEVFRRIENLVSLLETAQ